MKVSSKEAGRGTEVRNPRWRGSLVTTRLKDEKLTSSGWFWWLTEWKSCHKHTITSTFGLYEQLLPTRLHASQKTHTSSEGEAWCRFCGKAPESVAHILSGCRALAQSKYLSWHDSGTFLRDAAWSGARRWSSTLILSSQAKACIRVEWRTSLLGRDSFCRSWRGEMQQSWRPNGQPQNQVGHYLRNEQSVGQQQRKEERREDGKVCNLTLAIKTAVSWLRNEITQ